MPGVSREGRDRPLGARQCSRGHDCCPRTGRADEWRRPSSLPRTRPFSYGATLRCPVSGTDRAAPSRVGGGRCWRMRSAATVVMQEQAPAPLAGVLAWRRLVSARFRGFTASCVLREKQPAAVSGALGMQPRRARSTLPPSIRRNRRTKGRKAWDDPSRTVQMLRCGSGCCNDR